MLDPYSSQKLKKFINNYRVGKPLDSLIREYDLTFEEL